jgi:hypothetical protein
VETDGTDWDDSCLRNPSNSADPVSSDSKWRDSVSAAIIERKTPIQTKPETKTEKNNRKTLPKTRTCMMKNKED